MRLTGFDLAVLILGVIAVSTAAVLIREADAPALVISAYRLGLASLPLLLYSVARRDKIATGSRAQLWLCLLSGVFLALHFAFWVASVQKTSVVTSVVLVTALPLLVGLAAGPLLGEHTSRRTWYGIAIAGVGALVMVAPDLNAGGDSLGGDFYAVMGALFSAGYFLAGRRLQLDGMGWRSYVTIVYAASALLLIFLALIAGDAFSGYSTRTYAMLLLMALVPQLIGHTALNRSLGRLPAVSVTVAVLGEPVGATLLAYIVLNESPQALQLLGGAVVLAGVFFALRRG